MNVNIKNYTVRGLSFAITGQQYSGRLPGGEYAIGEEMDLCYSDLGQARRGRAVELVTDGSFTCPRTANGHWYGEETLEEIDRQIAEYV